MRYPNIYTLFRERVEQYGAREGKGGRDVFFVRRGGAWEGISWERFGEDAFRFGCALLASGLTRGASVCILMGNVPEWTVCDIGTISAGGVGCGLYPTSSAEQCSYIINHSDAEFVVVDTRTQLEKILSVRASLPKVKAVVALDSTLAHNVEGVVGYDEFLRRGRDAVARFASLLRERGEGARADDTAIMVYTSGTTGQPKGACLSHRYVLGSVESLRETIPIYDTDTTFSYLPFCHVAERISGLYNRLYAGAPAHFVDDLAKLGQYMLEVRPTVFGSLPRFFEKIHARIVADLDRAPDEERRRFYDALERGRERVRRRQKRRGVGVELRDEREPQNKRELQRDDRKLNDDGERGDDRELRDERELREDDEGDAVPVLDRVRDYFGGRLRLATSGGAPLPFEVAEFFAAAGIPILQAYGLTENVCVAFNRPENYKFGTVGPPMPGCEVRIAPDGEIVVRSRMMFSGYYKEPEKTAEVMRDGWLLTGDIGEMDADGFLKITGRKKELIVTSTGKNIAPSMLENLIKEHHLVSQAFVYGDGKSYLVALITLNPQEAGEFARARGIEHQSFAELARHEEARSLVQEIVAGVNGRVSSSESIKRFAILERDFAVEDDEVTPTLKLKRDVIAKRYGHVLQSLYE